MIRDTKPGSWAQHPVDTLWHSVRETVSHLTPLCGALSRARVAGTATLTIDTPGSFGPVCSDCAHVEGLVVQDG